MGCPYGKSHVCCTQISHLTVRSAGAVILDDVSLHLHCGEITAIVGRNGAGKTTFIKALLGAVPREGTVTYEGENKKPTDKPRFGYVPQRLSIDSDAPVSVEDLARACVSRRPVWLPPRRKDRERVERILSVTGAQGLVGKKAGELSGGEIQRVMLALALDPPPDILLLDEPISGVDRAGVKMFYELVSRLRRDYDMTIILTSHDLDLVARHADRVVLIDRGIAAQGTPREVYDSIPFVETFGKITIPDATRF